ncbi:DEAD/DEAH box helicase domain protein [sediment metagenome]|uniref:DEAD/DEAH box helicase domain protein n=1 Tax=sediment metagenome TaxID=749907 RepID=D9PM34_9ZZZZ
MQFTELNIPAEILKAISEQGYTKPTTIQEKSIPLLIEGKDIVGQSETGSGKTAAFGIPLLIKVIPQKGIQGLILTPTRELCIQVSDALKSYAKYMNVKITPVFGGVGIGNQIQAMKNTNIIVATPGRLLDLMQRGLRLTSVKYLVLDEADRMLDMGFIHDVEQIIRQTTANRQTILFSATLAPSIRGIIHKYMKNPALIQAKTHVDTSLLLEKSYQIQTHEKFSLLTHCLKHETNGIALVFCATRRNCDKISKNLRAQHIDAIAIHGGLSQNKRIDTINKLHKRGAGILIATDVASRGLHINNISHVYNYDIPKVPDDYVHRIGRTARAGAKGTAITFTTPQDYREFKNIMRHINREIKTAQTPAFEKVALVTNQEQEFSQGENRFKKRGQFWKRRRR